MDAEIKLIKLSLNGNVHELKLLLQQYPDIFINYTDSYNNTALNNTARYGYSECMYLLLNHHPKPDFNTMNIYGLAPLHQASLFNHINCIKLLCEEINCNKYLVTGSGWDENKNAVQLCGKGVGYADQNILQYLRSYNISGESIATYLDELLIHSAWIGNHIELQSLLTKGANINAYGGYVHGTALNAAACKGHKQCIQVLLNHSIKPNLNSFTINCGYSFTPLHQASLYNHTECIELLLQASILMNINIKDIKSGLGWNCNQTAMELCGKKTMFGPNQNTITLMKSYNVPGNIPLITKLFYFF